MSKLFRILCTAIGLALIALPALGAPGPEAPTACTGDFISISQPLNDLGTGEYVRLTTGPTGFHGGLYPDGSNRRPAGHDAAGQTLGRQVIPLNAAGQPDQNGRIGLVSIGMSNTRREFAGFMALAQADPQLNPKMKLVNGALSGMVASEWVDPTAQSWVYLDGFLNSAGVAPAQVQVAWVKLTNYDLTTFPQSIQNLQNDLKTVVQNLEDHFQNLKLVYLSSRTRAYAYWYGLNPEPGAFETGFAVKWLIEAQINGDPGLNYDPGKGPVVAPYLSWGPYLWIDGTNPRSDGMVWTPEDVVDDCTHPSTSGVDKVAAQLMSFFKQDATSRPWFLVTDYQFSYVPLILR